MSRGHSRWRVRFPCAVVLPTEDDETQGGERLKVNECKGFTVRVDQGIAGGGKEDRTARE